MPLTKKGEKQKASRYDDKLPSGYMYTPDGMMKISDYQKRTSPVKNKVVKEKAPTPKKQAVLTTQPPVKKIKPSPRYK